MESQEAFFIEHWPLTGVSVGASRSSYPTREVVAVFADQGEFAAKIDREPPAPAPAETDRRLRVLDHLAQREFPHAPSLLRTRTGARSVQAGCRNVCLLERIPHPAIGMWGARSPIWR
jgi:hypothetical protein